jgi:hypothetical protein
MCGAADQMGTCEPMPQACIEIFSPVCGCDGQTYDNFCFAAGAGTSVASDGPCGGQGEDEVCGGFLGLQCADGLFCSYDESAICGADDQSGTCQVKPELCIQVFDPVCGCDGQEYSNECMANAAGVSALNKAGCDLIECGGFFGLPCPDSSMTCVDIPGDSCDPQNGGADCPGMCI